MIVLSLASTLGRRIESVAEEMVVRANEERTTVKVVFNDTILYAYPGSVVGLIVDHFWRKRELILKAKAEANVAARTERTYVWDNGEGWSAHEIEFIETDLPPSETTTLLNWLSQEDGGEEFGPGVIAIARDIEWRADGEISALAEFLLGYSDRLNTDDSPIDRTALNGLSDAFLDEVAAEFDQHPSAAGEHFVYPGVAYAPNGDGLPEDYGGSGFIRACRAGAKP